MQKNISTIDRIIRILIFVAAAALYFTGQISGTAAIIFLVIGGILLVTGLINFCPIYWALGINKSKNQHAK